MSKKKLGILGGGQLGMFMCQAAKRNNIHTIVFSNTKNFSAKSFCDSYFVAGFDNKKILKEFIESSDFITIETENIPKHILKEIESKKKLFPSSFIIEISQNRLKEKKFLNLLKNIKIANFFEINSFKDLEKNICHVNNNGILKTSELGYDGKGQYKIVNGKIDDLKDLNLKNFILEKILDFEKEISVIVCRKNKKVEAYPVVENIHKNSILRETIYPANLSKEVSNKALKMAIQIADELDLHGILAVEMFLMKDKSIIVNELAPRPHNSGHWTLDYCEVSQFQNLINTIFLNSPKSPSPHASCKMINVIGDEFLSKEKLKKKFKFYDYFKKEIKGSRKMGHYTFKI